MDATTTWTTLVVAGVLSLAVAALGDRLLALPVSAPLLGLIAGVAVGPAGLGWLDLAPVTEEPGLVHHAAGVLLAVSVVAIALRYPFPETRKRFWGAVVLVGVVMPLMAVTTGAVAALVGGGLAVAALLGAALCPTDPVLSSGVVSGPAAERDLPARTRQLLSLESGSNDGLALPLVLIALAVAGVHSPGATAVDATREVGGGLLLGAATGLLAALAIRSGRRWGQVEGASIVVLTLVLAVSTLAAARLLDVGAVLAAFVAGLVLNALEDADDRIREVAIDESLNRYLTLPFFLLLGASLPWAEWGRTAWWVEVALVLGVLLVRRLPWLLLLARPFGLRWRDAVFLGWFGPIGVSAAFYLTEISESLGRTGPEAVRVVAWGFAVVAASTIVHAVTGTPGRQWYAAAARRPG